MRSTQRVILLIFASALSGTAAAQTIAQCPTMDCYTRTYNAACVAGGAVSAAACEALIKQLTPSVQAGDRTAASVLGLVYKSLTDLATDPQQKSINRATAVEYAKGLVERYPGSSGGYLILYMLSTDPNEKVQIRATLVSQDPSNPSRLEDYASALMGRRGPGDMLRAADQLQSAFELQRPANGAYALRLARRAIAALTETDQPQRASYIRDAVRQASNVDRLIAELGPTASATVARAVDHTRQVCAADLTGVLGPDYCSNAIVRAGRIVATSKEDTAAVVAGAKAVSGFTFLAFPPGTNSQSRVATRQQMASIMESFRSGKEASADLELAIAAATDSAAKRIEAIERAAKLEPGNRQAHATLADAYMESDRFDDARREYLVMRDLTQGMSPTDIAQYQRAIDASLTATENIKKAAEKMKARQ